MQLYSYRRTLSEFRDLNKRFWFRSTARLEQNRDGGTTYLWPNVSVPWGFTMPNNSADWATWIDSTRLARGGISGKAMLKEWKRDGVIQAAPFQWFTQIKAQAPHDNYATLIQLARHEFLMYDYHQHHDYSDKGWLRIMMHSIIQQIVRQDPELCGLHVALRPDHKHELLELPSCTLFAKGLEEDTAFRHLDVNTPDTLRAKPGLARIQCVVALNEENTRNCMEVILRMHAKAIEWMTRRENRQAPAA